MAIGSRPVSERGGTAAARRRLAEAFLALYFLLAPSTVPPWRGDPDLRPVAMLTVGSPMLPFRRDRR